MKHFKLIKQTQTQTQMFNLMRNTQIVRNQAVAAAFDVRPIAIARTSAVNDKSLLVSNQKRSFAAKL